MNELNLVELKQELMEYGLKVGDVGTIVHCMRENAILRWSLSGRTVTRRRCSHSRLIKFSRWSSRASSMSVLLTTKLLCRRTHSDWAGSISLLLKLYWRELRAIRKYPGTLVTSL